VFNSPPNPHRGYAIASDRAVISVDCATFYYYSFEKPSMGIGVVIFLLSEKFSAVPEFIEPNDCRVPS